MVVTFLGCVVVIHWLPHTLVQKKIVSFWRFRKFDTVFAL